MAQHLRGAEEHARTISLIAACDGHFSVARALQQKQM